MSEISCASLASAIKSNPSHLRELEMKGIKTLDSGVKPQSDLVESPHCRLESLRSVEGESLFKLVSTVLINAVSMKAEIWDLLSEVVLGKRQKDRMTEVSQPDEPEATGN